MKWTELSNLHTSQWLINSSSEDGAVTKTLSTPSHIPRGLVVRIRRSHCRGPGSIPGVGICFLLLLFWIQSFVTSKLILLKSVYKNVYSMRRWASRRMLLSFATCTCSAQRGIIMFRLSFRIFDCSRQWIAGCQSNGLMCGVNPKVNKSALI